jgi:ribosomal protein L29
MAEKKISKKAVKEASEVLTSAQLVEQVTTLRKDLTDAKRGHKMGELTNPRYLSATRKKIARNLTAIRAIKLAEAKEIK